MSETEAQQIIAEAMADRVTWDDGTEYINVADAARIVAALLDDRDRLRALDAGVEALRDEWEGQQSSGVKFHCGRRLTALLATRPDNEPT